MKNIKKISLILALVLIFQAIPFVAVAEGETVSETGVKSEIPYCDRIDGVTAYHYTSLTEYTAEEAAAAGVPEGFSGHVVAVSTSTSTSGVGITLDFSQITGNDIPVENIESMTMRVWYPSTAYEVRLTPNGGTSYFVRYGYNTTIPTGQWVDITIYADGTGFIDDTLYNFTNFADANGNLAPLNLVFRLTGVASGDTTTVYIDSVSLNINDPDEGKDEIPYCDPVDGVTVYTATSINMMSAAEAAEANVPAGYSDHVLELKNSTSGVGVAIDLYQLENREINLSEVESVVFRVCVPSNVYSIRITADGAKTWLKLEAPSAYDQWIDFELPLTDALAYEDGETISTFGLAFRMTNNVETTVYVDSVTVTFKEEETTAEETTETVETETTKTYYTFEDGMGKEEIPYGASSSAGTNYGYSSFMMMDEAQAVAAGVPAGYSGWVMALGTKGGNISIGLDLTNIKTKDIEKITFRVWCPTGTKQDETAGGVRLTGNTTSSWNMLANPTALEEWIDVVLEKDDFSSFDFDGDGYCDPTNFCFRGATGTAYIDHITVELRDPDTEPPVITYNGETVIETREGREFVLDVSAHDAYYDVDIELEYIWSEGAIVDGELVCGTHTCTVRATDEAGNTSEIVLTVNVGERDTEAPSVSQLPTEIYAMVGAQIFLEVSVSDNVDDVDAVFTWSDGALDEGGRLCAGEHTLTVTATDLSGNESEQVITVHVLETRPIVGELVQDE